MMSNAFDFLYTMKGPDFLLLYFIVFVFLRVFVALARAQEGFAELAAPVIGCLVYEIFGAVRMVVGSAHGLHKWDFLILMMVIGGPLFFVRFDNIGGGASGTGGGGWFGCGSSCGGGGGCGGGGCGGGGCGGCGGG